LACRSAPPPAVGTRFGSAAIRSFDVSWFRTGGRVRFRWHPVRAGTLFYLPRNRFYIGEVRYKADILPGEQPPILDRPVRYGPTEAHGSMDHSDQRLERRGPLTDRTAVRFAIMCHCQKSDRLPAFRQLISRTSSPNPSMSISRRQSGTPASAITGRSIIAEIRSH
jgi:hypothetical protein